MDRGEWIKEERRGFGPPQCRGVAIYGSRAGKDDAAAQLTQLIDGASNSQTPYHSTYARYGTRERWEPTTIEVQHYLTMRDGGDQDEINESILRLFQCGGPIDCQKPHTDATRGPTNTD